MARNTQVSADHNAPPITQILAQFVASHPSRGWSDAVDHEAHRTFLNWLGCAVGAARHEAADAALAAVRMLEPSGQATVLGRKDRVDMASAALINGITSHTFDFDDTHLKTIIHPAGPVASAVLALAERQGSSGRQVIDSLVLGIDVACRVGNMMYPEHYDRGWHITGSTGMLGAAAACSRLLGLDAQKTAMALGIAASQPVGMREQFGTMTKPFHPGGAARAGLMSALLASHGYTASPKALEAPRGFAQTVSTKNDWTQITGELGQRFEISFNSYKPFACGIVIHPSIDACAQLREQGVKPDQIERIELKVHSLVALRRKVVATVDPAIDEASVDVTAVLTDGRRVHVFVEHAIGSLQKPMSDAQLEAKFHGLTDPILGAASSDGLIDACWLLGDAKDVRGLVKLAVPA